MEDENVLDVWVHRQAILEDFGWQIIMVTAKNWLEESEMVLAKITQLLSSSGSIVIDSAD
jgi:very-short-patch-repair endonuclease